MGFLTRCKRPFLFAFLLQFCNMLFSFFLKTFLILFEKQQQQDEKDYSLQSSEPYGRIPYTEQLFTFKNEENSILQAGIINNFISAITKNEPVLCPVQQALDTQIFIQTAYLSAWKQKMTTLPPDTTIFTRELLRQPEE